MKRVAIIGGGLAGTACAFMLRRAGCDAAIYEAGETLAAGASGNALGLYNPRLSAEMTPEAEYYSTAFRLALDIFAALPGVGWNPCGALHLMTDGKRAERYAQVALSWGWPADEMHIVEAGEASAIAGADLRHGALWLARSGSVSPQKLCAAYAEGVDVYTGAAVDDPAILDADAVVLACGMGVKHFAAAAHLPLAGVRGQVTMALATPYSAMLKTALCYGGYTAPAGQDGVHMIGSTFQRWLDHTQIMADDDRDNIAKLAAVTPRLARGLEVAGHRAAIRTTARDQFPVVGALGPGLYVSTAHGSHGILSSLLAARIIASMLTDGDIPVSNQCIERLSPARFGT